MPENQVATSAGLLVLRGKLLFGLRAEWKEVYPLCWDAIGGRVENNENVEQALVRELREEISVEALSYALLDSVECTHPGKRASARHHIFVVFDWLGTPWNACDEHSELGWFSPAELVELPNLALPNYPQIAQSAVEREAEWRHVSMNH